jgi:hypothetical protein
VVAQLESSLGMENGIIELSLEAYTPEGLYTQDPSRESAEGTCHSPGCCLSRPDTNEGIPLAHCEPVMLVTALAAV